MGMAFTETVDPMVQEPHPNMLWNAATFGVETAEATGAAENAPAAANGTMIPRVRYFLFIGFLLLVSAP
jgi:hypothetical protein